MGRFSGVIFVSANGYHSFGATGDRYQTHPLFHGNSSKSLKHEREAFIEAFRHDRLRDERAALDRVCAAMAASPRRMWFLGIIAKRDLWGRKPQDVATVVKHAGDLLGEKFPPTGDVKIQVVAASFTLQKWVDGSGAVIAENSSGFDGADQLESLRELEAALEECRTWENM